MVDESISFHTPLYNVQTPENLRRFSLSMDGFRVVINETDLGKLQADVMEPFSSFTIASVTVPISVDQQHKASLRKRKRNLISTSSATPVDKNTVVDSTITITSVDKNREDKNLVTIPSDDLTLRNNPLKQDFLLLATSPGSVHLRPPRKSLSIEIVDDHGFFGLKRQRSSSIFPSIISGYNAVSPHHISSPESLLPPSPTYSARDIYPSSPTNEKVSSHYNNSNQFESINADAPPSPPSPTSPDSAALPSPLISLMQAASLVLAYDSMPEIMQKYVLLQLLRRASASSLGLVADLVQPALKRDFITSCPPIVSHCILSYLDKLSLCRASRVSRAWRIAVDSDQTLWKTLGARDRLWDINTVDRNNNLRLRRLSAVQGILEASKRFNVLKDWSGYFSPKVLSLVKTKSISCNENPLGFCSSDKYFGNDIERIDSNFYSISGINQDFETSSELSMTINSESSTQLRSNIVTAEEQQQREFKIAGIDLAGVPENKLMLDTPHPFKHMYKRSTTLQRNWSEGKCHKHIFMGHASSVVTCLQFDDEKIVSGSDDQTICVYNIKTGELIRTLHGHEGGVWALQYVGNILVSGSTDRTVRVWDLSTGRTMHVFQGHTSTVRCLQILLPNNYNHPQIEEETKFGEILSTSPPRTALMGSKKRNHQMCNSSKKIIKGDLGRDCINKENFSTNKIKNGEESIGLNQNGQLASGCCCCCPCFKTHGTLPPFNFHRGPISCCCADPTTRAVGYVASDTSLSIKPTVYLKHALIVTGSRDASLRVWRLPLHSDKLYVNRLAGRAKESRLQAENENIVEETREENSTSLLNNLSAGAQSYFKYTLTGHTQSVRALAGHDNIVVSGSYDATVCVWDVVKGKLLHRLTGHTQKVYSIVYDGISRCWSGSMDADVRCWNVHTGECLSVLQGHASLVGLLQLSPEHIISAAADSSLRVWDTETNQLVHTLQAHNNAITCFQYDRFKVVSGSEGAIKLWDFKTGRPIRDLVSRVANVWRLQINERWCVAAVNRNDRTEFIVMDFDVTKEFKNEEEVITTIPRPIIAVVTEEINEEVEREDEDETFDEDEDDLDFIFGDEQFEEENNNEEIIRENEE